MKLRKTKRISNSRISKSQIHEYWEDIDRTISTLTEEDKKKLEFAKNFVNELLFYDAEEGYQFQISPLDLKSLQYFAFSILMEYDIKYHNRNI
jgi:hypothetical protein